MSGCMGVNLKQADDESVWAMFLDAGSEGDFWVSIFHVDGKRITIRCPKWLTELSTDAPRTRLAFDNHMLEKEGYDLNESQIQPWIGPPR